MNQNPIRDRIKELRRVEARKLRPNPRNWRRHPTQQNQALLGILNEIGYAGALLAREDANGDLILLDGHARAGLTPDQEVPVLVLDLTEEEGDKLLALYDPISAMALADEEAHRALIDSLTFEDAELGRMAAALVPEPPLILNEGYTDPDDAPEPPVEAVTRLGDLWIMGEHRLLCGDSANSKDVATLMDGGTAQLVVTDPPYGVNYQTAVSGGSPNYRRDGKTMSNDNLGAAQPAFWKTVFEMAPFEGDCYVFAPSGPLMIALAAAVSAARIDHHQWLVWVKQQLVLGRGHYHYRHEHIYYGWRGKSSWQGSRTQDSVWEADRPHRSPDHPTMKPIALIERAILASSRAGALCYEPFSGSGTTILAAERLHRRCYAMEIDPRYVDVAVRRWEEYTGQKAECVSNAQEEAALS